jgi:hypothetical protein
MKEFLFTTASRLAPTQPSIQRVPWLFPLELKRPGREADRLSLSSAEIKKEWIYTMVYSNRTGSLERELQMVQLSAIRCSFISILWVSLVSFAAITLCVASQRVFVIVYFVIDSVRQLLDIPSYLHSPIRLHSVALS